MMKEQTGEYRPFTTKWLVDLYFRHGSVDNAKRKEKNLPFSDASFHRTLVDYGVVKNIGRRRLSFGKAIYFFAELVNRERLSIEGAYKAMPLFFKEEASTATLYRIYNRAIEKVERVKATALILTPEMRPNYILTAREGSGKRTIPLGHSLNHEPKHDSVLRVLQHEFSVRKVMDKELSRGGEMAREMIGALDKPFCKFRILDLAVDVYHINVPVRIDDTALSSYKVSDFKYEKVEDVLRAHAGVYRVGTQEMVDSYRDYLMGYTATQDRVSQLNKALLKLE